MENLVTINKLPFPPWNLEVTECSRTTACRGRQHLEMSPHLPCVPQECLDRRDSPHCPAAGGDISYVILESDYSMH